jgi:hypothetical protein
MSSSDGVNWFAQTAAEANSWQAVTYGRGEFVAVASSGTHRVMTLSNDITPPVIAPHQPVSAEATGPGGAIVNYTLPVATDLVDGTDPVTCLPSPGSLFPLGSTIVSCNAQDAAGNHAIQTQFTVTVSDTTPPAFTAPANMTLDANMPSGAIATYTLPTATDLVDGTDPVHCAPATGSLFPIGTTTVTCTSSDAHANTATHQFNVVVLSADQQLANLASAVAGVGSGSTLSADVAHIQQASTITAKCGAINTFIHDVNAQTGKKITQTQASAFLKAASDLQGTLAC